MEKDGRCGQLRQRAPFTRLKWNWEKSAGFPLFGSVLIAFIRVQVFCDPSFSAMFSNRRRGRGGFPLFLLAFQVLRALSGGNELFPVTLALIIGNVAAFIQPSFGGQRYSRYSSANFKWPDIEDICISAGDVWYKHQWKRLVLSPFFHLDEWHIYYNTISLLWKGISLERHFGSAYFLYMTSVFSVLTGVVYCGLQFLLSEYFGSSSYVWQCAAGFSGVLFAFKVVTTYGMPQHTVYIMGFIPIPSRHATWAELILIHVLVPRSSFTGHLAGILVGLLYVKGPLKLIMDLPLGGTQWLGMVYSDVCILLSVLPINVMLLCFV